MTASPLHPHTPVLIGAGQSGDRIDAPDYHGWSAADLAAAAARTAIADARAGSFAGRIDAIATTRTFEDTLPAPAPFGRSSNFPRSVARRLGCDPAFALWDRGGGNSPQDLVTEFAHRIAAREFGLVLLAGGEAISTIRQAQREGRTLAFAEDPGGQVEDRGPGLDAWRDPLAFRHGITSPTLAYALAETARRARLGASREDYATSMAELFAPMAAIAHKNPHAAWAVPAYTPAELVATGPHNRWVTDPYPLRLVARDQVNLGAAVLLASLRVARELGVPDDRLVYLHGHARAVEKPLLARPDLGNSPAARAACARALDRAEVTPDRVAAFDFYSCYPIAVATAAVDGLALSASDPRGLSLTGGLPFFGGPGNNYSLHAITEAVAAARKANGACVMVGANGGYLSKYSVGLYSAEPRALPEGDDRDLQARLDAQPEVTRAAAFEGIARIESYTVNHDRGGPVYAVAVARTACGDRLIARSAPEDLETARLAHEQDALGLSIYVRTDGDRNLFRFAAA